METIKRAAVNSIVKADATGTGDWIVGKISDYDSKTGKVTISPADGSEALVTGKENVFKATQAEFDEARGGHEEAPEGATSHKGTDNHTLIKEKATGEADEGTQTHTHGHTHGHTIIGVGYRDRYVKEKVGAKNTVHCGDEVAEELKALDVNQVLEYVAKKTGESLNTLIDRWGHLNPGQQRMCAGNFYRRWIREQNEVAAEPKHKPVKKSK